MLVSLIFLKRSLVFPIVFIIKEMQMEIETIMRYYLIFISIAIINRTEYTEYKKDLHDPDHHDGVITHLEPDILECEVKWTLGSITLNKASGGDGIAISNPKR